MKRTEIIDFTNGRRERFVTATRLEAEAASPTANRS
jgi:hypothetical protein